MYGTFYFAHCLFTITYIIDPFRFYIIDCSDVEF